MKKQIVILNSGGFDSVCLVHKLMEKYNGEEAISVFFDYGQRNKSKEKHCASKIAKHYGIKHVVIKLPVFSWDSDSLLFNESMDHENVQAQYLAMRNLIFFSYATSIAESEGCHSIYSAILEGGTYSDTTPEFVENFNVLVKDSTNINFVAPFIEMDKPDLLPIVRKYNITSEDFFSCNIPTEEGEPCNECGDCKCLKEILEEAKSYKYQDLLLVDASMRKCNEAFRETVITNAKLFINNMCNMDCTHCLFKGMTYGKELTIEDWKYVFDELHEMGIKTIDFGGKEPLVSKKIFVLLQYCRDKGYDFKYSLITNGKNVLKYLSLLVEYNVSVALSVESLHHLKSRDEIDLINIIKQLQRHGVDVSVSVDCHKFNYKQIPKLIKYLDRFDLPIYVKTIRPLGSNKEYIKNNMMLNSKEVMKVLKNITTTNRYVNFSLSPMDVSNATGELLNLLADYIDNRDIHYGDSVLLDICFEDKDFLNSLTISCDGHIIGNGEYLSEKDYKDHSIGNVLTDDIKYLKFKK